MRSVTEQEGASLPETLRHPVVHVVGREPVHLPDPHFKVIDRPAADIFEFERLRVLGTLVPYSPDQPCAAFAGQRKDGQEIGFVEVDMQFAVERRAGGFDICDVKDLLIGAAGKASAHRLTHQ